MGKMNNGDQVNESKMDKMNNGDKMDMMNNGEFNMGKLQVKSTG